MATLVLGATLSVGGMSEALQNVHYVVLKDLDSVRVVKEEGMGAKVVAKIDDGFAADSIFKLSRAFPGSFVSRKIALFDGAWLPSEMAEQAAPQVRHSVFHDEMARINSAIRREFLNNAVPFGGIIHDKASKYDVDPALVAAVMETESRFRTRARSQVGAQGLMQLMPRTGRWMGARNLYDPEQNVDAGTRYLSYLNEKFDGNLKNTIAAYNAGEGNVRRYNGVPPFHETRSYVTKVMTRYEARKKQLKDFDAEHVYAPVDADGTSTLR
ncbi:MAG: lytic transglycosylase domain-containing protein [Thermoanaerobaculia bacterium]